MARGVGNLLFALALAGCSAEGAAAAAAGSGEPTADEVAASGSAGSRPAPPPRTVIPDNPEGWKKCAERRAEIQKGEALPGAEKVEEQAIQFARVRSRAIRWRRAPEMPPEVKKLTGGKKAQIRLVRAVKALMDKRGSKDQKRKSVLSEGYLFANDPVVALALIEQVSLTKIFDEKTVYLQRGVDIYELEYAPETKLDKERYVYKGGEFDGERAEVLFGDRVAVTKDELEQTPSLVVDLGDLMPRVDFDRIKPIHLTDTSLVAEVRYGPDTWVPALLDVRDAKLELACEALTTDLAKKKAAFIDERATHKKAFTRLRAVVRKMVREKLPFDAGKAQTNGYRRKAWIRAYEAGWRQFTLDDGKDSHPVYTPSGDAMPPQVCTDFQLDVWERASGTWWQPAIPGDPLKPNPKRTKGLIDFNGEEIDNRRSVAEFVEFAKSKEDIFDVWEVPRKERIPFKKREEFHEYLHEKQDMFLPGDMITVFGMKNGHPHYHSLMVIELDPVTGVITLVAGNAVFPREQSLEGILQISPNRTLKHRVRSKEPWLKAVADSTSPL